MTEELQSVAASQLHSLHPAQVHWQNSLAKLDLRFGYHLINMDASLDYQSSSAGISMVVGQDGCYGRCDSFLISSPLAAEGLAVKEALSFAISRAFNSCVIESDLMQIVQSSSSQVAPPWELEVFFNDIRGHPASYPSIKLVFVLKTANKWANWFANEARVGDVRAGWVIIPIASLVSLFMQG